MPGYGLAHTPYRCVTFVARPCLVELLASRLRDVVTGQEPQHRAAQTLLALGWRTDAIALCRCVGGRCARPVVRREPPPLLEGERLVRLDVPTFGEPADGPGLRAVQYPVAVGELQADTDPLRQDEGDHGRDEQKHPEYDDQGVDAQV